MQIQYTRRDEMSWEESALIWMHMLGGGARLTKTIPALKKIHPAIEPTSEAIEAVADTVGKIIEVRARAKAARALERSYGRLVASSQEINRSLHLGFASTATYLAGLSDDMQHLADGLYEIDRTMRRGFAGVSSRLDRVSDQIGHVSDQIEHVSVQIENVSGQIEALRADFSWAMGALFWQMEAQQEKLKDILETIQAPLDTEAKELRKRAEFAYEQGWSDETWFGDALRDFHTAADKNPYDFIVHLYIGNIYLYHHRPVELDTARDYYLRAARYAKPRSYYHSALALMYAGFVAYLQEDDVAAIEYARQACHLHPTLTEAFYNHAKFAAAAGDAEAAIPSLEHAIRADRDYALKVCFDDDFDHIEAEVASLIGRLHEEARREAEALCHGLKKTLGSHNVPHCDEYERINLLMLESDALMREGTYVAYRDAIAKLSECEAILPSLRLRERDLICRETRSLAAQLRRQISAYEVGPTLQTELDTALNELDALLTRGVMYDEARQALAALTDSKREWDSIVEVGGERAQFKLDAEIAVMAVTRDEKTLVAALKNGTVRFLDIETGRQTKVLQESELGSTLLCSSPDGERAATGSFRVKLWDVKSAKVQTSLKQNDGSDVCAAAFSHGGRRLATYSNNRIRLWDAWTGELLKDGIWSCRRKVLALAFSPECSMLACGYRDGLCLWDVTKWESRYDCLRYTAQISAVALSKGGRFVAASTGSTLRIFKKNDVKRPDESDWSYEPWVLYEQMDEQTEAFAFSKDEKILAIGTRNGSVRLWDVESKTDRMVLKGLDGKVTSVIFSHDGTMLTSASTDGSVILRDWVIYRDIVKS